LRFFFQFGDVIEVVIMKDDPTRFEMKVEKN
jgi:hypothetical protein